MSDSDSESTCEVEVLNAEGLHARPVMRFVDLASTFESSISVRNITKQGDTVDGKSAMQMMLLEATQGCVLRIQAQGDDAPEATDALARLVTASFNTESCQNPRRQDQTG